MELNNLKSTPGSRHTKKRVGRGDKTAGRGENGQKSRAGYSKKIGFEGGQNPLYRRLPKRGFNNSSNQEKYTIINLKDLEKLVTSKVKEITPEILIEKRLIKNNYGKLKILGNQNNSFDMENISIKAHKFSKSAKDIIEKSGGKIIIIEK